MSSIGLNIALSALKNSQKAIEISSDNITNINTPGYSKLSLLQKPMIVAGEPAGLAPGIVKNSVPQALFNALLHSMSSLAFREGMLNNYQSVLNSFGSPQNTPLLENLSKMEKVLQQGKLLSHTHTQKQQVINSIKNIIETFDMLKEQLLQIRRIQLDSAKEETKKANKLISSFYQIGKGSTKSPYLVNQENHILQEVNKYIWLEKRPVGDNARVLISDTEPIFPRTDDNYLKIERVTLVDKDGEEIHAKGGKINGILQSVRQIIDPVIARITEQRNLFIEKVNQVHNQFSAVPPPKSMTSSKSVLASNPHGFSGTMSLHQMNPDNIVAQTLQIDFSTVGNKISDLISYINSHWGSNTASIRNGKLVIATTASLIIESNTEKDQNGRGFAYSLGMNNLIDQTTGKIKIQPKLLSISKIDSSNKLPTGGHTGLEKLIEMLNQKHNINGSSLTFYESVVTTISHVTLETQNVQNRARIARSHFTTFVKSFKEKAGVNMEEEIGKIMMYRRSYAAATKLVQTIRELFKLMENLL